MKQIHNRIFLTLCSMFVLANCAAQNTEDIETEIQVSNVYDLSIVRVYPDFFPQVSVIFQAENELGMPIWELGTDELTIKENGTECEVVDIRNISNEIPLNIGLVLDASGSMSNVSESEFLAYYGENYRDSLNKLYLDGGLRLEYDQRPWRDAMDHAKLGLRTFLTEESLGNDSIQLVVFSHQIRTSVPLTSNHESILEAIDSVVPMMNTAFYDAVIESLNMVESSGDETVIVALTDGQDNASLASVNDVIALAKTRNVKVFVIGLGNVFKLPLEEIANKTGGEFHYTEEPEQLSEIYRAIKKKIKSVYEVTYVSEHADIDNSSVDLRFSFTNDTLKFINNQYQYELPSEAVAYIKRQDTLRKFRNVALPLGIVGLVGLTVFFLRRNRKKELIIKTAYPNPFDSSFQIEVSGVEALSEIKSIQVIDQSNQPVRLKWTPIGEQLFTVDLLDQSSGLHLVIMETESLKSKPFKIIRSN